MALISPSDQEKLRESFAAMTRSVRLLFFTQTLGCDTCLQTRQILDELPPLSDKIAIDEVNLILDGDKAKAVRHRSRAGDRRGRPGRHPGAGTRLADPVSRHAGRLRVHLARAGRAARRRAPGRNCPTDSLKRLAAVDRPVTMQVFTTPT